MKSFLIGILNVFVLWLSLLLSSIIAATILAIPVEEVVDGPFTGGQAFLIVNAIHALVLTLIAQNSSLRGLSLAVLIAVTLFAAQSFLLLMEAFYFIDDLEITRAVLLISASHVLMTSIFCGLVSSFLWRSELPVSEQKRISNTQLVLRILIISVLYVLAYFIAGYYIAWASSEIQRYYHSFEQNINLLSLLAFQLLRGALWGLLAFYMVNSLSGAKIKCGLIVASSFSALAVTQLLYPSIYMPWTVRSIHMVEVGFSNFIFGFLAALILSYDKKDKLAITDNL